MIGSGSGSFFTIAGSGGVRIGTAGFQSRLTIGLATFGSFTVNDPVAGNQQMGRTRLVLMHFDYSDASSVTIRVCLDPDLSQPLGSPNQTEGSQSHVGGQSSLLTLRPRRTAELG